jgi:hypothetical protein
MTLRFVALLAALCVSVLLAEESDRPTARGLPKLPPAYAPILKASNQRCEAAQRVMDDWRAKRDALAARLKALEDELTQIAAPPPDVTTSALASRLKSLDAALKKRDPASFTEVGQFAQYDQLADERAALRTALQSAEEQRIDLIRKLARRSPRGATLADAWETLNAQVIAAANEATLAQVRRDNVHREEAGVLRSMTPPADNAATEVRRLDVPPPPDAAARLEQFRQRTTADAVRALGERFFSQMTLTLPGLEPVAKLVQEGRYDAALEGYKKYFFARLQSVADGGLDSADEEGSRNGEATRTWTVFPPPTPHQIEQALDGLVVETVPGTKGPVRVEARLGRPGAMHWVFAAPGDDVQLAFCRRLGYPGATGAALLHSYAVGGPKEHLLRWSEILDDWCLNWQRDVERSTLPVRDYNLLYVCRIQGTRDKLKTIAQMRPSFVDDLPAATLARWLLAMNEEYLASAIRLGRSGLYNFRIMALNSMLPTSLRMQEFHAHQWAVREGWRQVDNNFLYKIRRDGANFEFANDGHENTDQFLSLAFEALRAWRAQPEWLEPFWDEEFLDNFLSNARYRVHNLKPDGYCYRLSVRPQRSRYLGTEPEYKVQHLADEAEVRRRLWKVFHIGQPEEPPRINSESLAFQGYYYLRAGWEPDDYFLYFQSIGQPILSGREENTGFSLYGRSGSLLLCPAPAVDGKTQNIHHGLVLNPGGKAPYATYGRPDVVKNGRFLAGDHFDVAEGEFTGVYDQRHPRDALDVFGDYGYKISLEDEPITDVRQSRQIVSVRDRETYIVTDIFHSAGPHRFTQNHTIYTPVRLDHLPQRLELLGRTPPLTIDRMARTLTTHNIGLPNLQLRHISALPLEYELGRSNFGGDPKKFTKRDRQQTEASRAAQFSQQVAVQWRGQGSQLVVTLVLPQIALRDVKPIASSPETAGFTGRFADGGHLAYMASVSPRALQVGGVEATASALLLAGDRGLALDCARIGGLSPREPDFTFRIERGKVLVEQPIYRPIQPVVIEPQACAFTDTATVALGCATPGVEIHYTLDGARPVPQSPRYTGPFTVDRTCRLKARAFRPGVTEDVWQQDGTHATVVSAAVLRKEPLTPASDPARTAPGLKYEYFEGIWTEVMIRSLTMPAQSTGVLDKLLDVSPRKTDGAFGIRYTGFLDVPRDGVYTFHAPREFLYPDNDCGYDLRVFVDGREWYPAVRWHGHGTWSVALQKGKHPFQVVFADLRLRPHKVELMWGFPHPDFTWKGVAPTLLISDPALPKQPVPDAWLCHPRSS